MKLHTKHRQDIQCQGLQDDYLGFLIFCDFDPHFVTFWENDNKIQNFQNFQKNVFCAKKN